jgi:hypothetical protein
MGPHHIVPSDGRGAVVSALSYSGGPEFNSRLRRRMTEVLNDFYTRLSQMVIQYRYPLKHRVDLNSIQHLIPHNKHTASQLHRQIG